MPGAALALHDDARREAEHIVRWWLAKMPDNVHGGFVGEIDGEGRIVVDAPKSVILNTRLLWFFSAAAQGLPSDEALVMARRSFDYLRERFLDSENGGLYWLLDASGDVIDYKKQAYAQAFGIYALAEYYLASGDDAALAMARRLQTDIETRFRDTERGGYIEALSADWQASDDQRLSDKDLDAPKTMNTHLHVLEGYTRLHQVAPDAASEAALREVLDVFLTRFVGPGGHLRLFFDMDWNDRTNAVSYGHDIEASWLLWEAVIALGDADIAARARPLTLEMAQATLKEGMNGRGGIAYECTFDGHLDPDGEWWGQAEGLVGFVNAWELSGETAWLDVASSLWDYVKAQYGAGTGDEWTWYGRDASRPLMVKAGQWKCPYHTGRAMLELIRRLPDTI